jgi:hypothetical protein
MAQRNGGNGIVVGVRLHSRERAPEFDHRLVGSEETSIHEDHDPQTFNFHREQDSFDLFREALVAKENGEDARSTEDRF